MRSTGEVMGLDRSSAMALAKSKMAAGLPLPTSGRVFLSVRDSDKSTCIEVARSLVSMGFTVCTTMGTRKLLDTHSVETELIRKISEGVRPNILDLLANGEIDLIINTPTRTGADTDEGRLRAMAVLNRVPMITTGTGALAAVSAISALRAGNWTVNAAFRTPSRKWPWPLPLGGLFECPSDAPAATLTLLWTFPPGFRNSWTRIPGFRS